MNSKQIDTLDETNVGSSAISGKMRDVSRVQDININRHSSDGRQREVTIKFIMKRLVTLTLSILKS